MPLIELAPGIKADARPTELLFEDVEGYDVTVVVTPTPMQEDRAGGFHCSSVTIAQRPGGPVVTALGIRGIAIGALARETGVHAIIEAGNDMTPIPEGIAAGGPTDEALRRLAEIYRAALVFGEPPARTVRERLGITAPTAGRWIARARERGFLGPSEGRKGGG